MKQRANKPEIREALSGAFFVKIGNDTIGGFRKKEHAEEFLKLLTGEALAKAWQEGVDAVSLLIDGQDIHLTGELINPYKKL